MLLQRAPGTHICRRCEGRCGNGRANHGGHCSHRVSWVITRGLLNILYLSRICRQTVHHLPEERELFGYKISSTLQIGDPAVIAIECGVTTVGDFRIGDVAAGGQGAPLVPYLDQTFLQDHFEQTSRLGLLLNVGGISNFSAIVPERDLVFGFDCGPGGKVHGGSFVNSVTLSMVCVLVQLCWTIVRRFDQILHNSSLEGAIYESQF